MITKAIVEEIVSTTQVRVRIPLLHKISTSSSATPFNELPIATICTFPGIDIKYDVGDVVYVSYEDNLSSKIVVIGELAVSFETGSSSELNVIIDGGTW